jgi:ATP-dependent Zn protease
MSPNDKNILHKIIKILKIIYKNKKKKKVLKKPKIEIEKRYIYIKWFLIFFLFFLIIFSIFFLFFFRMYKDIFEKTIGSFLSFTWS